MEKNLSINYTDRIVKLEICNLTGDWKATLKKHKDEYVNCGVLETTIVLGDSLIEAFDSFLIEAQYLGHHVETW